MKICIIISNFYPSISKMLLDGAINKLKKNNIKNYRIIKVPGTLEIPTVVATLINKYKGFIVLGCVIKGQTAHFNFLCNSVFTSLINLSVKYKKPMGNGILTCNNMRQAIERVKPDKKNKGGNAADAMISVLKISKNA